MRCSLRERYRATRRRGSVRAGIIRPSERPPPAPTCHRADRIEDHALTSRRLRVLFDLSYPGYLRYFDAPIVALADRGHEVEVWFENDRKQVEGLKALDARPDVHVGGRRPRAERRVRGPARAARTTGNFLRFLDPAFADAGYLRRRAASSLPVPLRPLARLERVPARVSRRLVGGSLRLDSAVPISSTLRRFLDERSPDVVVVSSAVSLGANQADLIRAARAAGIATVVAVASWDNLTTKGLLRGAPDRVLVWNGALAGEAVDLHCIPLERIRITGAPCFDKWFDRTPNRTAAAFARRVGLEPGRPFVLFVGSTGSISAPHAEVDFVRNWVASLRASADERLRDVAVLVRPHPYNSLHWDAADLSDLGRVAIWPRGGANPVDDDDRADYFDSIFHAQAIVGINTSAMVEGAIVGRPVLTVTLPDFAETQEGTVHFRHLLPENGGFLRRARTLEEHVEQLADVLRDEEAAREELRSFVASFIRPLDRAATPSFADEVERAAQLTPVALDPPPLWARALYAAAVVLAAADRVFAPKPLARRLHRLSGGGRRRAEAIGASIERTAASRPALDRPMLAAAHAVSRAGSLWSSALDGAAIRIHEPPQEPRETMGRVALGLTELEPPGGEDASGTQ